MIALSLIGLSFIFCLLLTPAVRNCAVRFGWVDRPDLDRHTHEAPVPRVGGVSVMAACGAAVAVLCLTGLRSPTVHESVSVLLRWLPAIAVILVTGILDDLVGLRPKAKLAGEGLAAALFCLIVLHYHMFSIQDWGSVWKLAFTLLWIVGCTNAWNLIDGSDGLAAGLGFVAALTVLAAALLSGHAELSVIPAVLAGSLLGFLCFNFAPASIFLGDSGSLSVGFLFGCLGVAWSHNSITLPGKAAAAVAFSIPLLDMTLSIARRFVAKHPIFTADRGHIHHRLIERGFTTRGVCLSLCAASGVASCFSLGLDVSSPWLGTIAIALFCVFALTAIQLLRYQEFRIFAHLVGDLRSNVQRQLLLQAYEQRLRDAAGNPEECWSVLRKAGRELGCTGIVLRLGGRHFEERSNGNGHAGWKLSVPMPGSDYVSVTAANGSLATQQNVIQFANLLHRILSERPAVFPVGLKKSRIEAVSEMGGAELPVREQTAA